MRLTSATAVLLGIAAVPCASAQLTIRLTALPANTPAGAAVHVAGSFNVWNPAGDTLARQPDGTYVITLPAAVRGNVAFKFTLGSWDRVEQSANGTDVPNREFTIPSDGPATYVGTVAQWKSGSSAPAAPKPHTATKSVTVVTDSFAIPQLGRIRRVWLYLPPDYSTSRTRYPVLYMHDGQNVFDAATSFSGEWGVDETLDSLHSRGDRGAIVVAVDNGGKSRLDEYDPWKNANANLGGGEGDAYVDFLVHTLKPWVDGHYRTLPGPRTTGIMGSSMGGLISLYAALKYPQVFGSAGVFSCACWVADPHIYQYARHVAPPSAQPRLYFVSGAFETKDGEPAANQRRMVDSLVAVGYDTTKDLVSRIPADGKHSEWFWRREFPAAYRWMMHPPPMPPRPRKARRRHRAS